MASLDQLLRDELDQRTESKRLIDLCLILRRRKTRETLLMAGGRWDRLDRQFTDADPEYCKVIDLEESQVAFTRWFARWLRDFREGLPRDISLAVAGGDRRGGKTFDLILCTLATAIDVPLIGASPLVGWIVSVNYQERDEVDRTIREVLPQDWYQHRKAPEFRYTFANGGSVRNVSADDPETLKRGRVDIVTFNEGQKMPVAALSNGIYGTVDKGGIALVAANPPRRQVGEWVLSLKEAIDEKQIEGAKFFGFSSKDNTQIEQGARSRVGGILRLIDPRAALADDDGMWLPVGDRAYPKFDRKRNLGAAPDVGDVTAVLLKKRAGRAYDQLAGVDFQGTPHHAGVILRAFGSVEQPIYYAIDEIVTEQSVEEEFLADVDEKSIYEPGNLLWIGDASGQFQDGQHTQGRRSFDIFRQYRWHIKPPVLKKTDKGEWSKNPHIDDRLNLVNKLLDQRRLVIDPNLCPRLSEALKECPLKSVNGRRKPYGRYSHITDALGYALFWAEPKPKAASRAVSSEPRGGSFPNMKPGSGFRF